MLRGPDLRAETDVPETEDPDGCPRDGGSRRMSQRRTTRADCHRRMFLRRKVKTDEPAVMSFLLRNIHACHLPWPYVSETDVPETDDRDGGPRRMPETDVPETEDQDGSE